MANVKFQLDCPKCETEIVIRSTAQIGQKVECPKCKYRFTVPDLEDEDDADDDAAPKGKKGEKKSGSKKVLIGVVLGVLALAGLGLGAFLVLGGGGDKKPVASTSGGGAATPPATPAPSTGTEAAPGGAAETPGGTAQPGGGEAAPRPTKRPRPAGLKEITNLLPGAAVSVWHLHMDELSKTPLYASIFDTPTKALFLTSMTFDASELDEILHCYVGPEKEAFAILRTKRPFDRDEMTKGLNLESPKNNVVKGREFYLLKSNAFLTAISKSLSLGSVLGVEGKPAKAKAPKPGEERKLAFNIYDSQTIVLADPFVMERFLSDLKDDGLPPFKSELTQPDAATPPATPGPMGPAVPGAPMGAAGSPEASAPRSGGRNENAQMPKPAPGPMMTPPMGGGGPMMTPPMGGGGPMTPGATPPPVRKSFTSNPFFRTIDPELKKALNTLEDDDRDTPAAVYVQKVDPRSLGDLGLRVQGVPQLADTVLLNWLQQVKVLGFSLTAMNKTKGVATGYFEYLTDDDAKKSVTEHILPVLNGLKLIYALQTRENVTVNDQTQGQGGGTQPGSPGYPGGPGGNPGYPGAPTGPMGMPRPGGSDRGPESSSPRTQNGSGGEDAQLKPGSKPGGGPTPEGPTGPAGPGGSPYPGGPGGMPYPGGPGGSPYPGGPGGASPGGQQTGSHIDVSVSDTVVSVQFELEWQETTYQAFVMPGLTRMTAQLKGRMSVLSGENDAFSLASSFTKVVKEKGSFPKGALERDAGAARYGLPYPPEQRVSLFADLLPYLGKAGLRASIRDKQFAWYAKENLPAAETWVPEFLVPSYDPSAWRATHELAEGRSLGATNYVGLAGLGLDAARYDPKDPAVQKKMGLYGYDWTSRPDEVTDGLSNTIALMQVPPGYQRPWIAGGGATLTGIDDRIEKPLQNYVTKLPDGTRGTTVLMGDGSVRTVRETIDPAVFKAMVTRAGGDALDDLDKAAPKVPTTRKPTELNTAPAPVSSVKPPVVPKEVDAEELKKLQGKWKAVVSVDFGKELTNEEVKKDGSEILISGTTFRISEKGNKGETGEITKLDPSTSPKTLDFGPSKGGAEATILMAYECNGTKLKLRMVKGGKERAKSTDKPAPGDMTASYGEFEKVE